MNLTIAAIVLAILAIIAALWMFARRMRQGGEATITAKVAEETADNLRRQDKAAADAAAEDTVDRLRGGRF